MTPDDAAARTARSAELQGLLAELTREHACNQALMRQELSFLDHLLRLVDPSAPGDAGAYTAGGIRAARRRTAPHRRAARPACAPSTSRPDRP